MEQLIQLKVIIHWNDDEITLEKEWFEKRIKNMLFETCDNAEVELHILPIKSEN